MIDSICGGVLFVLGYLIVHFARSVKVEPRR